MWIARDEDGCLWVYKNKPVKKEHNWDSDDVQEKSPLSCYMKEFKYVKWTDKEPKRLILEQADEHTESSWVRVTERLPENDFNCIVTEAERYINSVWHDMKEKPDFKKLPVLLKHKSGVIHFIDSTPTSWKYLIKHYVKWVYIRDLLPNEEK